MEISPGLVRAWRAGLLRNGVGASTVAGSYRLLRAVLNTALDDELIRGRNPCRIKGADKEDAAERPTASVAQLYAIAGAIKPWYRALVLMAGTTGLRSGELIALRRQHLHLDAGFVHVSAAMVEVGQRIEVGRTKSAAGVRTVGIPRVIVDDLRTHLATWSEAGLDGRVFVGRRARRLGGRTSAARGVLPWPGPPAQACPLPRGCISTTCGTRRMASRRACRASSN